MFHKICVLDTGLHYEEEGESAITHSTSSHSLHYQQPHVTDSALLTIIIIITNGVRQRLEGTDLSQHH